MTNNKFLVNVLAFFLLLGVLLPAGADFSLANTEEKPTVYSDVVNRDALTGASGKVDVQGIVAFLKNNKQLMRAQVLQLLTQVESVHSTPPPSEQLTGQISGYVWEICPAMECPDLREDPSPDTLVIVQVGERVIAEGRTDEDGFYQFTNIPANTDFIVEVTIYDPFLGEEISRRSDILQVYANENRQVDFRIPLGEWQPPADIWGAIGGTVTVSGEVYGNMIVKVWNSDLNEVFYVGETDEQGDFFIGNVPVGVYRVTAQHAGDEVIYENYYVDFTQHPSDIETLADYELDQSVYRNATPYLVNVTLDAPVDWLELEIMPK